MHWFWKSAKLWLKMIVEPKPICGRLVRLEPLAQTHISALDASCGNHDQSYHNIWRYLLDGEIYRQRGMAGLVAVMQTRQEAGSDLPFAIVDQLSGSAVGTTRIMEIDRANNSVEIGTWIGRSHQRRAFNVESKYLLLKFAFVELGVARVQFRVDHRNSQSLSSMEYIRATREGVLRDHILLPDGTRRSSVIYSVIASDWRAVQEHLENLLDQGPISENL